MSHVYLLNQVPSCPEYPLGVIPTPFVPRANADTQESVAEQLVLVSCVASLVIFRGTVR